MLNLFGAQNSKQARKNRNAKQKKKKLFFIFFWIHSSRSKHKPPIWRGRWRRRRSPTRSTSWRITTWRRGSDSVLSSWEAADSAPFAAATTTAGSAASAIASVPSSRKGRRTMKLWSRLSPLKLSMRKVNQLLELPFLSSDHVIDCVEFWLLFHICVWVWRVFIYLWFWIFVLC